MIESSHKDAFYKFKPESCVFVIANDKKMRPNGMIAGWNMKCSNNPPLFAVSLSKNGNTHKLILDTKEFTIAVPNKSLEKEINIFGSNSGKEVNKFELSKIKTEKAKYIKTPLIKNATINFECKLFKHIDSGDHVIFLGEILTTHINKDENILFYTGRDGNNNRIFKEFK